MIEQPPTAKEIAAFYATKPVKGKYNVDHSEKGKADRTWDNIVFDSVHEMKVYRDHVKMNLNAGIYLDLQFQVPFELHAPTPKGTLSPVGKYVADFVVKDRAGNIVILEAKGVRTPLYKRSKKHFEAEYGVRITEL
jgi:hypothetical protein